MPSSLCFLLLFHTIRLNNLLISMDQKAVAVAVVVPVQVRDSSCHYRNDVYCCQNRMVLALVVVDQNLLVHICFQNHSVPICKFKNHEVGISGGLIGR